MDSRSCAILQCFYIPFANFTSHFVAILEIAILLERIKIMNPFVKKHFTISSKNMILITFFPCLLFNSYYALCNVPYFAGEFYYFDSNGIERVNSFWFASTSTLAQSTIGSILTIAFFFIKDVLTLITTIVLNAVTLFELKIYFKNRSLLIGRHNVVGPIPVESTNNSTRISEALNETQNSKKKNHIKLMLIMCSMSMAERISSVLINVYSLFSIDYITFLLATFQDMVFVLGPSVSFFIFYHFNGDFKREFSNVANKFILKFKSISTVSESFNET